MTPGLWTISGLAVELAMDRRTVAARLRNVPPDGQQRGTPAWLMASAVAAVRGGAGLNGTLADGRVLDLNAERARLAREQADQTALKNARLRGELVPLAEVVAGWQMAIGRCRSLLLGIASHFDTPEEQRRVRRLVEGALRELANTRFDADGPEPEPEAGDAGGPDGDAA